MDSTGAAAPDLRGRKREIVELLSTRPRMSVSQLASALGLTAGGVRQQLAQLESAGTIVHEPGPGGRGRFFYSLGRVGATPGNHSYHRFVVRLLQAIENEDGGVLRRAAGQMWRAGQSEPAGGSAAARLWSVERGLEEDGFAARIEPLGGSRYSLRLLACPVEQLAGEFPSLCEAEEQCLLRCFAGFEVARDAWRLDGAGECSYVIDESTAAGTT